jgi:hypothetical protein
MILLANPGFPAHTRSAPVCQGYGRYGKVGLPYPRIPVRAPSVRRPYGIVSSRSPCERCGWIVKTRFAQRGDVFISASASRSLHYYIPRTRIAPPGRLRLRARQPTPIRKSIRRLIQPADRESRGSAVLPLRSNIPVHCKADERPPAEKSPGFRKDATTRCVSRTEASCHTSLANRPSSLIDHYLFPPHI